jgi:small-conductance mechanosensitive channel
MRAATVALAFVAALMGVPAVAADALSTAALDKSSLPVTKSDGAGRRPPATVVIFNRPIVRFRAPLLGISPEERVENAQDRIHALLERGGQDKVTVETIPQGAAVKIDGAMAFVVLHEDAERLGEDAAAVVASDAARALERVIEETREARNLRTMALSAAWAAVATAIFLSLLWLLRRALRWIDAGLTRFADRKGREMLARGAEIVQRDRVLLYVHRLVAFGGWVIGLLFAYKWIGFVLARFPFTRPWGEHLDAFLVDTTVGMLEAVANSVPGLLVAIVIFVVARFVDGLLGSFFDGVQTGRVRVQWLDADSARPTRRLAAIAVWIFAVAMAYPYIPGAQTDAFKGLSVLVGLMVSVGASGIVGQAASGLILMYTRTYRPGEYVRINEHEGTVVGLGLFTTRVRTGLGEELTFPNSLVFGTVTRNYSRAVKGPGFIVDTTVTIGYDAPWRQVQAMLVEAARRTQGVLSDPSPRVFQTALSDFYVEYRLVCQAVPSDPRPRAEVLSALHANVLDVFNEHGVQIMSPHYFADPSDAKLVPPAKWYAAPAKPPG